MLQANFDRALVSNQLELGEPKESAHVGHISQGDMASFLKMQPHIELSKLGFASGESLFFQQEAKDTSTSKIEQMWHGVKRFFGSYETVEDKLRENVMGHLTPNERKKFDAETKAEEEYQRKFKAWAMQENIHPGDPPQRPEMPMHEEVEKRVAAKEKQIVEKVRSEMSQHDRERLDRKLKEWFEENAPKPIRNPMGTGEGFNTKETEPPPVVKDYYERIREAAEAALRS